MAKVTIVSPPAEWPLPSLMKRTVFYDPVHGELIGAEVELPGDVHGVPVTDDVGAYTNAELVGDEGDEGDEEEEYEDTHEEGVEEPEEDAPDPGAPEGGEVMQMGPDDEGPGPSGPPSFSTVPGVTAPFPLPSAPPIPSPVSAPAAAAKAVFASAANFQKKLMVQDPKAMATLNNLRVMAPSSPLHAAVLKVVTKPVVKPTAKKPFPGFSIRPVGSKTNVKVMGVGVPVHAVSRTAGAIIKLALSPVAWATNGVGVVAKEVGGQLQGLARKL
jgi:hypothetical protein